MVMLTMGLMYRVDRLRRDSYLEMNKSAHLRYFFGDRRQWARDDPVTCRRRAGDRRFELKYRLYIQITSFSGQDHHRYLYFYVTIGVWFGILLFDVSSRLLSFFLLIYIRVSVEGSLFSQISLFYLPSLCSHFPFRGRGIHSSRNIASYIHIRTICQRHNLLLV